MLCYDHGLALFDTIAPEPKTDKYDDKFVQNEGLVYLAKRVETMRYWSLNMSEIHGL